MHLCISQNPISRRTSLHSDSCPLRPTKGASGKWDVWEMAFPGREVGKSRPGSARLKPHPFAVRWWVRCRRGGGGQPCRRPCEPPLHFPTGKCDFPGGKCFFPISRYPISLWPTLTRALSLITEGSRSPLLMGSHQSKSKLNPIPGASSSRTCISRRTKVSTLRRALPGAPIPGVGPP